ncbi:MAG: hypothetical protein KJN60_12940 [Boseongicola sp.]|nr:hypothetical protein [Boseongicola sp.]
MSVRNVVDMVMNVSGIIKELETTGMRVVVGDDFSEYRVYRNSQTNRSAMYPMFDVACSYIDDTNGFWICGFNDADELVHTQAVRLLDLNNISLAQHLNVHRHKYITPYTTPDLDLTFYQGPEALRSITGRVCYHGEFWLPARGLGGPRAQGVTPLLSRLLFEVMHNKWDPNYTFAFVPKQLAEKGAHMRYGYSHCEPGKWIGPDQQVTEEDYLVWMSANDMINALSQPPQSLKSSGKVSAIREQLTSVAAKG